MTPETKPAPDVIRKITVYLATRNSSGVVERVLHVRDDDRVIGHHDAGCGFWRYLPMGHLSNFGTGRDWRMAHCFNTYEESRADYIALEKKRIATANAALKQIAA